MKRRKVAVIGAGPCGLPACKALAEAGIDYECLEAGSSVGGVWNLDGAANGAYRSLHTNTSTRTMAYSDFPFEEGLPPHLPAAELQKYFERYCDHHDLRASIRFGHRVLQAEPLADGAWRVEVQGQPAREYSALIVATGQYVQPREPQADLVADYKGEQLHVFDYCDPRTPVDCRGKSVLVVGLGSSAAEVAAELADPDGEFGSAGSVHVSARSGRWVINKIVDGKPIDSLAPHPADLLPPIVRRLPESVVVWLMRRVMKAGILRFVSKSGSPQSLGLPVPVIEPWEDRPTMSLDFIPAIREQRIEIHPGIDRFEQKWVYFIDGSRVEADVVLWATGYQLDFPFLSQQVLGCAAPDLKLYQKIAHPGQENLFFVGCLRVACSMWPVAEQQSRWIAKLLSGGFRMPSSATRIRRADSLAQSLPVMCNAYVQRLRRQAGGL